ncbi:MAG: class I SAM-dependent methyltransferase [Nitrospinota bacterium]|nr:class I SAM-dependent methyltransferase [Nitrospinota bacterium]
MDLVEQKIFTGLRHPWETSRVEAVKALTRNILPQGRPARVLDLGCGDGYVAEQVFGGSPEVTAALVDVYFTDDAVADMESHGGRFTFHCSLEEVGEEKFHTIMMLDVLEHEENDLALLRRVTDRLADNGAILLTVPAFQSLFSRHDEFLRHFRRYSLGQLTSVAKDAGLVPEVSGYLYTSLLLPRLLAVALQRMGITGSLETKGVGGWNCGPLVTGLISGYLALENSILIALARMGIRPPGLTAWTLCRKQR